MAVIGLQTSKTSNNLKVVYLILLLPLSLFLCIWIYFSISICPKGQVCHDTETGVEYEGEYIPLELAIKSLIYSSPIILLWLLIGISMQKQLIYSFTKSKDLDRKNCPDLYNIVENLSISRGIPMPRIGIIEDNSMNAFATGWTTKNSCIVFSRGLLKNLTKSEIEAVAAHEMTHIINGDVRVMVIINVFIGMIGTVGYILLRSSGSSNSGGGKKGQNPLLLLGVLLYFLSILVLPFINLAISRKKEFLADAGSVELIKNNQSLISALQKISQDSRIEAIDGQSSNVTSMFIANPSGKTSFFRKIFMTHPPIEDRIEMLKKY